MKKNENYKKILSGVKPDEMRILTIIDLEVIKEMKKIPVLCLSS